jgi:glutathione-regulated potassium-efflux system ancillary protein KefF
MITIIYAHPYAQHSKAGRALLGSVRGLPQLEIRELYEMYPDFHIDIKKEQEQLLKSDLIVLQTPLYWYHTPALMSLWLEKVLALDWAHGHGHQALKGKKVLWTITTGDVEDSFQDGGYNNFPFHEIARPMQQTVLYCGMKWLKPFTVFNANKSSEDDLFQIAEKYRDRLVLEIAQKHN